MEYNNSAPIYMQIIEDIKSKIVVGSILPGDKLPSTRQLALDYSVNPNTAGRVYKEMEGLEMVYTKRGMGTYVNDSEDIVTKMKEELAGSLIKDFIQGMKNLGFKNKDIVKVIEKNLEGDEC